MRKVTQSSMEDLADISEPQVLSKSIQFQREKSKFSILDLVIFPHLQSYNNSIKVIKFVSHYLPVSINHKISVGEVNLRGFALILCIEELWESSLLYGVDGIVVKPGGVGRYDDVMSLVSCCVFWLT